MAQLQSTSLNGTVASGGDAATLTIKQAGTTFTNGIYLERAGERNGYYMYIGGALDALTFRRNYFGTQSDVISLTRDGNVGIGTASPSEKLEVQDGYLSTYHNINANDAGYGVQFYTNGGGSKNSLAYIGLSQVGTARTGNLSFQTSNAGAPSTKMTITAGGNVLVNTTSIVSLGNGIVLRGDNNGVGGYGYMQISGTGTSTRAMYLYNSNGLIGAIGTDGTSLLFATSGSDTERMRITSGGVVRITSFTTNGLVGTDSSGNLGVVNLNYTEIATGTITYSMNSGAPWGINNSFPSTIRNYDDDLMAGSASASDSNNLNRGVTFDLGSAKAVRKIVERGYNTKNLNQIIVQYSTDNSNWTDIYVYNHVYSNTQKNMEFNPTGAISARYWRWFIHSWSEREVQNYYTYESIIYT
jgi:hypothetical protein